MRDLPVARFCSSPFLVFCSATLYFSLKSDFSFFRSFSGMARTYLPPGFRFHPTDEELIVHYLKKKVAGRPMETGVIAEIEIYKFEPPDLPGFAILCSRDPEWFFFNFQDKKARTNRTTRGGYWKATGKDRKICVGTSTIGWKKTLVYYLGRAPTGRRTDWIMHEYRLDEQYERGVHCAKPFVLCRVRRKGGPGPRNGEQYGAPVLDLYEEDEVKVSVHHSFNGTEVEVPPDCCGSVDQGPVSDMQPRISQTDNSREDMGLLLHSSVECEHEQQEQISEVFSPDALLDSLDSQEEVTDMGLGQTVYPNPVDTDGLDSLHDLLHPGFSEAGILDNLLQQVKATGDLPANEGYSSTEFLQNVGFLELADLESPLDGNPLSEFSGSQQFEEFRPEFCYGVEGHRASRLEQHERWPYKNSNSRVHGTVDVTNMEHTKELTMVDRQLSDEVPQIISEGLGIVDNTYSSLVTSKGGKGAPDDLPSGSGLSLDEEGSMYKRDGQFSLDSGSLASEKAGSQERSLDEASICIAQSSALSIPSSPSTLAKVLIGIPGKVNALPASAADLPMKPEPCKLLPKGRLKGFEDEVKLGQVYGLSLRSRKFAQFRLSGLPLNVEQVSGRHGREVEWAPMSHLKSSKGLGSGLSLFLFWIATSALILFCFFRGFSRSTRSTFSVVL